ncbi:unnamed protein product [Lymnaea stagnalis]|uniref:Sulfotransferase domain-containing protein n=1 Tax=Lymnaea stagnalis TaxID=6523 RepID=A0AAV2HHY6_LYMST
MKLLTRLKRRTCSSLLPSLGFVAIVSIGALMWGMTSQIPFYTSSGVGETLDTKLRALVRGDVNKDDSDYYTDSFVIPTSSHNALPYNNTSRADAKGGLNRTGAAPSNIKYFSPPPNDAPIRRFPKALIIGFGKCGTRALLSFLSIHPYITAHGSEVHFYTSDKLFAKGYKWYLNEMPFSYSNQITIEKSPDYVCSRRALQEISAQFPDIKLIILVRNPVERLVSAYLQRYRFKDSRERPPLRTIYINKTTNRFDPTINAVNIGVYYRFLLPWFHNFPREQLLVLDDETLTSDPLRILKRVEKFLKLPPMLSEDNFYLNATWGFYCFKRFDAQAQPKCMNKFKGVKHPDLPKADEEMLYAFYRPHNERLFKLIAQRFDWEKKSQDKTSSNTSLILDYD